MRLEFFPAGERGAFHYGWLSTNYSFSFGDWYRHDRMGFGALRVLNDDVIAPSSGFPTHGHANMEIVTIPLSGSLAHEDSAGGSGVIRAGDVQAMTAGMGIRHSEKNPSVDEECALFQLWIIPRANGLAPSYGQKNFGETVFNRRAWQELIRPDVAADNGGLPIAQDAWIHSIEIAPGGEAEYVFKKAGNGCFLMVAEGECAIGETRLGRRDALAVSDADSFGIISASGARLLAIEIPA